MLESGSSRSGLSPSSKTPMTSSRALSAARRSNIQVAIINHGNRLKYPYPDRKIPERSKLEGRPVEVKIYRPPQIC